jgi:hypothetical protein
MPEVRKDWAQYYDRLTMMDRQAGERLAELTAAGLDDDTIIFYYGDHGSGMPRSKRWLYNSGLCVPLIVYVPPKWQRLAPPGYEPGGSSDRLVSFYELGPTLLNVCGVEPPSHMHGRPFMGPKENVASEPQHAFGFRGRMDERYDLVRAVRDKRYLYIRNFMPHKPYGQYLDYMFQTPTTRVWKALYDAGELNEVQSRFWRTKPSEELYDLQNDPDEVVNLADSPAHLEIKTRLREALREWILETRDVGFLPESEIHARAAGTTPYDLARDPRAYPLPDILDMAERASDRSETDIGVFQDGIEAEENAVRYWSLLGLLIRGEPAVRASEAELARRLDDSVPACRTLAAQCLAQFGTGAHAAAAVERLLAQADLEQNPLFVSLLALNALDAIRESTAGLEPYRARLAALPREVDRVPNRLAGYVPRLLERLLGEEE